MRPLGTWRWAYGTWGDHMVQRVGYMVHSYILYWGGSISWCDNVISYKGSLLSSGSCRLAPHSAVWKLGVHDHSFKRECLQRWAHLGPRGLRTIRELQENHHEESFPSHHMYIISIISYCSYRLSEPALPMYTVIQSCYFVLHAVRASVTHVEVGQVVETTT